jgi:hypothetical protein
MSEQPVIININCPGGSVEQSSVTLEALQARLDVQQNMIQQLHKRLSEIEAKFGGGTLDD